MGLGPFDSFAFPDVYTKTLLEPPRPTAAGDIRFAAFIGVANETKTVSDYEMIRGSSPMADNKIVKQNVSAQFDGTNRDFTVTYFPIVTGAGTGTVSTDPQTVTVYQNGFPVPVASVDGATGVINLVSIPSMGDEILCTYYFKRTDTQVVDEDLTDQIATGVKTFRTHNYPIVQGDNGGITSTDPASIQVVIKQGTTVITNNPVVTLTGDVGLFTLSSAPTAGQTIKVTYFYNDLQDTQDILPSPYISAVTKISSAPGASASFTNVTDYVVDTTGAFTTINWGASAKVADGQHTIGSTYFGTAQVTTTLYDNQDFRRPALEVGDGTNKTFTLDKPAMSGQGIAMATEDPSKITAWYGTSPTDATSVAVLQVIVTPNTEFPTTTQVVLAAAPDASKNVYITEYVNQLPDENWTLTCVNAGGTGVGTYNLEGVNTGVAMNVAWSNGDTTVADTDFSAENVTYMFPGSRMTGAANGDMMVTPGYAVAETVKLTFNSPKVYIVSSTNVAGTGSQGDNTGYLNQTYIDKATGFRVTVAQGATVDYSSGDVLGYTVSPVIPVGETRAALGIRLNVANTTGVGLSDTALVNTYNKSGREPKIGDFYYVTFQETKQFNSSGMIPAALFTQEKDMLAATGDLTINNKVGLAGHLAFLNGSPALAILQVQRATGSQDAADSRYIAAIDYFNDPMVGGIRPSLLEPVTTSPSVISYLKTSNVIQSGIRYANERMSYFGFPLGTTPTQAQVIARSMNSMRMTALYPDGAITTIPDAQGNDIEYLVDGAMIAAAMSGRDTSPAWDVAEPIDRKPIVGFRRLYRRMDSVTSAMTANAGITLIEEQSANMIIKMGLTTELTSVLTRTPSVVKILDFVQKGSRASLRPYIGQKFLSEKLGDIETTLTSYLGALRQANIITAYQGVKATPDANDATIVNVEAFYSPVLPLQWIVITFNMRSSI